MSNYNIDWQSGGLEGIPRKTSIVLPQKTLDSTSTSLTLTGKGVNNYGEIQQENFLRLMENFASAEPPSNPTIGQLWYNTLENVLYIHVDENNVGDIPLYYPQSPARWAQVWPAVSSYASLSEYSQAALTINRIIGKPSEFGSNADVANNQYGWGQTDLVPEYTSTSQLAPGFSPTIFPQSFDNNAWVILLSRLRKALRHIGQPETAASPVGFVSDGRPVKPGNTLANTYNNFPTVGTLPNYESGFGGFGNATLQTHFANTINAISTLDTNRFKIAALSSEQKQLVSFARTASWQTTLVHEIALTFSNEDAAKAYFNSGGYFRFAWSHIGGADAINSSWTNFLAAQSELIFDYRGMRHGNVYENSTTTSGETLGFYDLTTSFKNFYTRDRQYGAYAYISDGGILVEAKKETLPSGAFVVYFNVSFTEALGVGETIVGTTTSSCFGHKANNLNTNMPIIQQPVPNGPINGSGVGSGAGSFTLP